MSLLVAIIVINETKEFLPLTFHLNVTCSFYFLCGTCNFCI
uniref:Uncharacterized protein n=1 Tax=Rhizophora mucronata TaxID=61149 RepID=A0A2P2NPF4_RHIMU